MLNAGQLATMRQALDLSLPTLCTRQTRSTTADGMGGVTETWANTANVPCRLTPMSARDTTRGDQFVVSAGWLLTIRYDQAMASGDRVVIGSDTFEVVSVEDVASDRVARRAFLRRMD